MSVVRTGQSGQSGHRLPHRQAPLLAQPLLQLADGPGLLRDGRGLSQAMTMMSMSMSVVRTGQSGQSGHRLPRHQAPLPAQPLLQLANGPGLLKDGLGQVKTRGPRVNKTTMSVDSGGHRLHRRQAPLPAQPLLQLANGPGLLKDGLGQVKTRGPRVNKTTMSVDSGGHRLQLQRLRGLGLGPAAAAPLHPLPPTDGLKSRKLDTSMSAVRSGRRSPGLQAPLLPVAPLLEVGLGLPADGLCPLVASLLPLEDGHGHSVMTEGLKMKSRIFSFEFSLYYISFFLIYSVSKLKY